MDSGMNKSNTPGGSFEDRSRKACGDGRLRGILRDAVRHFSGRRTAAFDGLDVQSLRDAAREVRTRALACLPESLRRFEQNALALGIHVHWARNGSEARDILLRIARDGGVRRIVKGKSMLSEEIGLNHAFEAADIEVTETDLGEFINQLAGDTPSHMIAPSLHHDRRSVAGLFAEHVGETSSGDSPVDDPDAEIREQTAIARRALRRRFLEADMGITGANIAVAETGSLFLVENEGNIRLSTTLPRIHAALVSIEKIVPTLEDAARLMAVLPRSAAGQTLSSYTSVFTGPAREGEIDGAREMHVVLLDNGRSKLLADPVLREILLCLRCSACLNACPVYRTAGGHSYGWVYSGPIGSLLTALDLPEAPKDLAFACTQCRACTDACPVQIDHASLHLHLRERLTRKKTPARHIAPAALAAVYARPALYRASAWVARTADPKLSRARRIPVFGRKLSRWAEARELPALRLPFSKRWARLRAALDSEAAAASVMKNGPKATELRQSQGCERPNPVSEEVSR